MSSKDAEPERRSGSDTAARSGLWHQGPERGHSGFNFADEDDDASQLVRPYTVTGGRTQPRYQIAIEALVSATVLEPRDLSVLSPEEQAILQFCRDWRSVAEISAVLRIPLGVTRILVADMAANGLVRIHQRDDLEGRPDLHLLERVLSGLRKIESGRDSRWPPGPSVHEAANVGNESRNLINLNTASANKPENATQQQRFHSPRSPDEAAGLRKSPEPPWVPGGVGGGSSRGRHRAGDENTPPRRYLLGRCPQSVPVGKPFSLLASIVLTPGVGSVKLERFDVPPQGRNVLLVIHAPRLQLLSDQQQTLYVPPNADSNPVRFEFRADTPGPRPVSVTAWIGGSYLGELLVEITAERDRPAGPHRDITAEIDTEATEGAVSLVVRYDPTQNAYRFEFRDEDNPEEVTSNLAYDPGPLVERLVAGLDELVKGRSGYSAAQARDYLMNSGAALWSELVPKPLREQFWDRQHRIRQLTILADKDTVPWELLYPRDPGHDAGFLVEQFPVARAIFGRRLARRLSLRPLDSSFQRTRCQKPATRSMRCGAY